MARSAQLVCQHLENISRDIIKKHQAIIRHYVRRRHGIYALHSKGKLYYVGLASNLHSRLKQHLDDRHGHSWDRFSVYLTIGDSHLRELESLILRIANPKGNKQKGKIGKAENLRRRLARDVRASQRDEYNELIGRIVGVGITKAKPNHEGRTPALQAYVSGPMKIRAKYKRKNYTAKVRRDGTIRFNKKVFTSPSLAASSLAHRAMNGWHFWKFERAPGDWVRLNELRK